MDASATKCFSQLMKGSQLSVRERFRCQGWLLRETANVARTCEYIVAHELINLIEPTHNERFHELMEAAMPNWRLLR